MSDSDDRELVEEAFLDYRKLSRNSSSLDNRTKSLIRNLGEIDDLVDAQSKLMYALHTTMDIDQHLANLKELSDQICADNPDN